MKSQPVPSYNELFFGPPEYESILAKLSKESVIITCIAIINELNSIEEKYRLQKRIYEELAQTFPSEERARIDKQLSLFWEKIGLEFGVLFHRSYLLEMILMELNAPRADLVTTEFNEELNFFKAYICIVTTANRRQAERNTFEHVKGIKLDFMDLKLELLWGPVLSSYEFNELPHLPFEQFKVMAFLKFASDNYHAALGQYLSQAEQSSIGRLLNSFNQVNKTTTLTDPNARLKKLAYITPNTNISTAHLDKQCLNLKQQDLFRIRDIKMNPLYLTQKRGYMVIDPSFYMRKNYYGPFFELRTETSLKDELTFNSYSSQVSQALESKVFKPLFNMLCENLPGKLKVDDGTPNAPDGYFRIENLLFVLEYKASIFPEALTQTVEIKEIAKFLDKKFVNSENGKKGINQLAQKLEVLSSGGYEDDPLNLDVSQNYRVYPIIIHHDFYFSLPGVNDYLRHKFEKDLPADDRFEVMPLVVMNLSIFYDLLLAGLDITVLDHLFIGYYKFLQDSTRLLYNEENNKTDHFLAANMSFDEFFNQYMLKQLPQLPDQIRKATLQKLFDIAGISFEEFNKPYE